MYDLIGEENIRILVDEFYERVFEDQRIAHLFKTDKDLIKQKQFMFLCQFLGGPAYYNNTFGPPKMRMRHLPHPIDENAVTAWLECMKEAVDALNIDPKLKVALYNCFPKLAHHMSNR